MSIKFPKYKLTEKQIKGLANIVQHEQGTAAGQYAEASLMANLTDIAGDSNATVSKLITRATSGWFAYGKTRYRAGYNGSVKVSSTAIKAVRDCIVKGKRTLPRYVNEHDCISDLLWVKNGSTRFSRSNKNNYVSNKTKVHNRYGATWTFYTFPGGVHSGVDPFGYTSQTYRKKWGDFCYTLAQSQDDTYTGGPAYYSGTLPVLPDASFGVDRNYYQFNDGILTLKDYTTQIKRVQSVCNWALGTTYVTDGKYGADTVKMVKTLQKKAGLPENGKFGQKCLDYVKSIKK